MPTKSGDSLINLPEKMYIFASRLHPKKEEKCNRKRSRNYLGYLLET